MSMSEAFGFEERRRYSAHEDEMSLRAYIGVLSILIAGGLILATMIATFTYAMTPSVWWIIGYFVVALPGIWLSASSENWTVSLTGYLMVITATGAITGPYVHLYTVASVVQVALITIGVTVGIGAAGVIYPKSVEHWGGVLLMGLLLLIFGDVARMFMVSYGLTPVSFKWWDWAAVLLFCGFIFYDMNRATRMSYTMDNAVDSAVALYLDILNLFLRLLSATGKKR